MFAGRCIWPARPLPGYPYFIQFICKEVYDAFIQRMDSGEDAVVPVSGIMQKLDMGFFAGRWGRLTDRQRELLFVMATLDDSDGGFSVQEAVVKSRLVLSRPFGSSHVHQMLTTLGEHGLIFKKGYGRYAFAIPLLADYIRRRMEGVGMGGGMTVTQEELVLRRRAYWLSIQGDHQEIRDQKTVTVRIPESNVLDVETLQDLMEKSRKGEI